MKPTKFRRLRKLAIERYPEVECRQCLEMRDRPKHLARMSVITKAREAIAKDFMENEGQVLPGNGSRKKES